MTKPIYLDYAATTPVDPRVIAKMNACLSMTGVFGNPSSKHAYGLEAAEAIEWARELVATEVKVTPQEIVFTSGATESINLALKGATRLYQRRGKHVVTMKTEHKATIDAAQQLEKEGYQVTYLSPDKNGELDLDQFKLALRDDTVLVSIMHVNNETGVIQPIEKIAEMTNARQLLLHIDAAQSIGKIKLDLSKVPADLVSLSAHKVYGPKGIGALYLRKKPRVRVEPLIHGGGHEQGMRSGTLPTHQIVGMGAAYQLATLEREKDAENIKQIRDYFLTSLKKIKNVTFNTDISVSVPHILNVQFNGMIADAILADLPLIATSTASACQGKGTEGSYVLRAMGLTEEQAKSSIRFSFGRFTTMDEIKRVSEAVGRLF